VAEIRPDLPAALSEVLDACLDPDPERRPLASELEGVLNSYAPGLDGSVLPPIETAGLEERPRPHRPLPIMRLAPAVGTAALCATALLVAGAPPPLLLASPFSGLIALARARPALLIAAATTIAWLLLGAGEPGAALVVAALVTPLLLPLGRTKAVALPALAPLLGIAGLAPVYPALAGLTRSAVARALLGAAGYFWLAAAEMILDRTLLFGADTVAPVGWQDSGGLALTEVLVPLLSGAVLASAGVWALAAVVLPVLVRGRAPVLDALGALIWAAGLISALRLVAGPDADPPGLLLAALLAAGLAAVAARRLQMRPRGPGAFPSEPGTGVTA
jgi:hypothetical protein